MKKRSRGFTVVELTIVLAIVGIMAAVAIPELVKFTSRSRRTELYTALATVFTVETAYFTGHQDFLGGSAGCVPGPPWDKNFTLGPRFSFPAGAKFYSFCIDVATGTQDTFQAQGAGNIDSDGTVDLGYITHHGRNVVLVSDDVSG